MKLSKFASEPTVTTTEGVSAENQTSGSLESPSVSQITKTRFQLPKLPNNDAFISIESRFDLLKARIDNSHERFDNQDQSLRDLAAGMIDRSELLNLESTLNTLAAQADAKF